MLTDWGYMKSTEDSCSYQRCQRSNRYHAQTFGLLTWEGPFRENWFGRDGLKMKRVIELGDIYYFQVHDIWGIITAITEHKSKQMGLLSFVFLARTVQALS